MNEDGRLSPVEAGRMLFNREVGEKVRVVFEWKGTTHEKEMTITLHEQREDASGIRPVDAPAPHDIHAETDGGVEYIFVTASVEGDFVGNAFGEVSDFERQKSSESRSTQLTGSEIVEIEVIEDG